MHQTRMRLAFSKNYTDIYYSSLPPYLESLLLILVWVLQVSWFIPSNLHYGTPPFPKDVSGTPVFKILVRILEFNALDKFLPIGVCCDT